MDWVIYADDIQMMIIFNVGEKEIQGSVKHYNKLGKLQKVVYSYKPCKVVLEVL